MLRKTRYTEIKSVFLNCAGRCGVRTRAELGSRARTLSSRYPSRVLRGKIRLFCRLTIRDFRNSVLANDQKHFRHQTLLINDAEKGLMTTN